MPRRWRAAMADALYGPDGFFVTGAGPAAHFRTSTHASPLFATAILRLLADLDEALGRPDPLDLVDIGAGRGELLLTLATLASPDATLAGWGVAPVAPVAPDLRERLRLCAVELAPRPDDLPTAVEWRSAPPTGRTGLLLATEWLDNVPLDVAEEGRYLLVDQDGAETPGPPVAGPDARWLARWWPSGRAEIGLPRDEAWAGAVATLARGAALCVDYGHSRDRRPIGGTLTGFRDGRAVPPVPDGNRDLTAHVALDAVAAAGAAVAGLPPVRLTQREVLHAYGIAGARPPLDLASRDPAGYLRALATASLAAELTDPAGLGGHQWLLQPVGVSISWPGVAR